VGGRLGAVVKSYLATVPGTGATAQYIAVEEFAGDDRKAQVFGPVNEDSAPPATIKTINIPLGSGRGFLVSIAYYNQHITPIAKPGERRLYSTDENGEAVQAEIHLKQDGEIYAANGNASSTIAADGTITIINPGATVTISAAGAVSVEADGDIALDSNGNARLQLDADGGAFLWGLTDLFIYTGPFAGPTAFVRLLDTGVASIFATTLDITADVNITGDVDMIGNITTTGTLKNNGDDIGSIHKHGGVTVGLNKTGTPTT
jgi:hypothetical protein